MSRCIDADALEPDADYYEGDYWAVSIVQIHNAPTIEPRCEACEAFNKTRLLIPQPQRKKGHWIRHPEQRNIFNGKTIECSECHEKYTVQYVEDEWFCRHCGADMRGDGAECQST